MILAVDTTSPGGSAAILREERIIASVSAWTPETYSSRMFRQVEFLLAEVGAALSQVDLFAVSIGPGSFTGLRVGLAGIKAWAEAYGKPVIGVSALEAIAAQARALSETLVPVVDARRGEVYFGFYSRKENSAGAEFLLQGEHLVTTPADFLEHLSAHPEIKDVAIVTSTPEVLQESLDRMYAGSATRPAVEFVPNILAPTIGSIAARRARSGIFENALTLDANYVRRTDAELKWKAF